MNMVFRYFTAIIVAQIFFFSGPSHQANYGIDTELGQTSRIDLLTSLKIALANSNPTNEERQAALTFANFLNTPSSDDYLEAFFSVHDFNKASQFATFLNGIVYNGNPAMPVWKAAETLAKMIKKENSPKSRNLLRPAKKRSVKEVLNNFVKAWKNTQYFLIDNLDKDYNSRKTHAYSNVPCGVLLQLILKQLNTKLHNKEIPKKVDTEHPTVDTLEETNSNCKRLPEKIRKIIAKGFPKNTEPNKRFQSTHVFYAYGSSDNDRSNSNNFYTPYMSYAIKVQ